MNYQKLDIATWNRREHYHFFNGFEEPFYGVTVEVECTNAFALCKERGYSFFLYYLYQSMAAANKIEAFRYRIVENEVRIYDSIGASATINRPDHTFGFSYMPFYKDFEVFEPLAKKEVERVRNGSGLELDVAGHDVIHYSALPWLRFTAISHARSFSFKNSCPKISFGKLSDLKGQKVMPISVHVHHALVDGHHVGMFVEEFENLMSLK